MPEPLIAPSAPNSATPPSPPPIDNAAPAAGVTVEAATRPEGLPENLWDADAGQVKHDDVLKSYLEISKTHGEREAQLATLPQKADEYKIPETVIDDEIAKIIPAGQEITIDAKDPRLAAVREFAHANKLSQESFSDLVKIGIKAEVMQEKLFAEAREAELKKLGVNAPQRTKAVVDFLSGHIGQEDADAISASLFSAKQFEAFEKLIAKYSGQSNVIPMNNKRDTDQPPAQPASMEQRWYGGENNSQKAS
jgi:hypothetical protein